MRVDDEIAELQERLKKVKLWPARIEKLRKRKNNPMSEAEFCRRHKLDPATFNRNKNLIDFPRAKTVLKIEKALKSEGV